MILSAIPPGLPRTGQGGVQRALYVSVIVAAELRYGCVKTLSFPLKRRVEAFLSAVPVIPFEAPADRSYAEIRVALEAAGLPIVYPD